MCPALALAAAAACLVEEWGHLVGVGWGVGSKQKILCSEADWAYMTSPPLGVLKDTTRLWALPSMAFSGSVSHIAVGTR